MSAPRPRLLAALATAAALLAPAAAPAADLVVFAAASLKTALDEIAEDWHAAGGAPLAISYAGSGQLARQIVEGAPAAIFISAATDWMDVVEDAGLIAPGSRVDLLGNRLVLIGGPEAQPVEITRGLDLPGLLDGGHLAMALVDSVPAGQYGKAALTSLGIWEAVAPHVAQADNVRGALALVSTGEAPYGIVYATDAAAEPQVTVVGTFSEDSHAPVIYPAALLTGAGTDAAAFFQTLQSEAARATFAAQGFSFPD